VPLRAGGAEAAVTAGTLEAFLALAADAALAAGVAPLVAAFAAGFGRSVSPAALAALGVDEVQVGGETRILHIMRAMRCDTMQHSTTQCNATHLYILYII
jgi:hypothetical protein